MDSLLSICKMQLGSNKLLVEFQSDPCQNEVTIYESGPVQHSFSSKQIKYLDIFLGPDAKTYISAKNPLAYAESEKGMAFVLGRQNKSDQKK